ncbi:GntP family permease [Angustibacter sp. McL0619]|uniref:GntP family permease n=1 Tax=Angustibacter sp. McL0619 TaxID=3415676 RepID=UPI003CF5B3E1
MSTAFWTADPISDASSGQLFAAALIGIAVIVVLITWLKVHPFLALTIGSLLTAALAGAEVAKGVTSFSAGVGATVASVGVLIALGAMFGKLLADSGGAAEIVDTIVDRSSARTLPWAMALVGALIGLPMFFEIGLVLLVPIILLVAQRSGQPLMKIAIPTLAGLSVLHGFVPPHPGPLAAIGVLKADLGVTLALGLLIAIPTVIIAGPLFAPIAARWAPVMAAGPAIEETVGAQGAGDPTRASSMHPTGSTGSTDSTDSTHSTDSMKSTGSTDAAPTRQQSVTGRRPSFPVTLATVLLPVVLMLGKAVSDIWLDENSLAYKTLDFLGTPLVALLLAVVVAIFTLGVGTGMDKNQLSKSFETSLPPIAGPLLIVAAGGGFKQVLVDTGIGGAIGDAIGGSSISPLLLAWVVAVLIRLATGSATVATITAAGIMAPLAGSMSTGETSLLVLAIGSGSLFFSHVNDAGFWLVKEYFGLTVGQTIKSWSVMETIISVTGIILVMLMSLVV